MNPTRWSVGIAVAALLSGCVGPVSLEPEAPEDQTAPLAPLPAPIHDEKTESEMAASTHNLGCNQFDNLPVPCFEYPVRLERGALVVANLTWENPNQRMWLTIVQGTTQLATAGGSLGETSIQLAESLDLAGDYVLWVQGRDGYVLDAHFGELPLPVAPPARPAPVFGPHVIIGIPDTGINPYHEMFYRPELTEHPCTYLRDFPCTVKELRLTVGQVTYAQALARDRQAWEGVERGTWYWIPQTAFVAVYCQEEDPYDLLGEVCILDEGPGAWAGHGTGTTSIAIAQNPDAYLAFHEGPDTAPFLDAGIPVDLFSFSWAGGLEYTTTAGVRECEEARWAPFLFKAAGNDGRAVPLDCQTGGTHVVAVGGGYSSPRAHDRSSGNMAEFENHMRPPYAERDSTTELDPHGTWGGTSFATPAVAGAASKAILDLRRSSGYDGSLTSDGFVDPILGISLFDLRDAMNRTASYAPVPRFDYQDPEETVPLNPLMPWMQWGWGFYDVEAANATVAELLGTEKAPEKPAAATAYMESLMAVRERLYG